MSFGTSASRRPWCFCMALSVCQPQRKEDFQLRAAATRRSALRPDYRWRGALCVPAAKGRGRVVLFPWPTTRLCHSASGTPASVAHGIHQLSGLVDARSTIFQAPSPASRRPHGASARPENRHHGCIVNDRAKWRMPTTTAMSAQVADVSSLPRKSLRGEKHSDGRSRWQTPRAN